MVMNISDKMTKLFFISISDKITKVLFISVSDKISAFIFISVYIFFHNPENMMIHAPKLYCLFAVYFCYLYVIV